MTDALRAAIRSAIESVIALVVILGLFSLTTEQVGAIMLVVTNFLTLTMFVWKTGQSAPTMAAHIGVTLLMILGGGLLFTHYPLLL